jgi:hypothetical protein
LSQAQVIERVAERAVAVHGVLERRQRVFIGLRQEVGIADAGQQRPALGITFHRLRQRLEGLDVFLRGGGNPFTSR